MAQREEKMKLPIKLYGDPILRKKGAPVTEINDFIRTLVSDMSETMHAYDGIGIAAPQVGHSLLLFVTHSPIFNPSTQEWENEKERVWINPKLIEYSKEVWKHEEGCLSIPNVHSVVERFSKIRVETTNLDGTQETLELVGWPARVFQHEYDHIQGKLFIDHVLGREKQKIEAQLKLLKKMYKKGSV